MFDMLTLDELYTLHSKLCHGHTAVHARIMDNCTPLIPVTSDEWGVLTAHAAEIFETVLAVGAEIRDREAERVTVHA